jgi:hypothetical protein
MMLCFAIGCVFWHGWAQAGSAAGQDSYREVKWEELVPASWHPEKIFEKFDLSQFSDNDPRADKVLEAFNEAWRNAPANPALQGQRIKIPGFVVPLDWGHDARLGDFLLVPYFGACIHVPPPPANQIVYVRADDAPVGEGREVRLMDIVWVYGTINVERNDSGGMGASSYSMKPDKVEPYQ